MENEVSSLKKQARTAGLLFLIWIITGLYSLMYLPSQIKTGGDAATVAQNVLSHEFLFRTGIVCDVIGGALWILLVLAFYRLFRPVSEWAAKLLVGFVVVQIPVVFSMAAFKIASLKAFKGEILTSFEPNQRQDLALTFLKLEAYGTLALETFWGLWLFPLALLVYQSRFLPRFLGIWLAVNGLAYLVLSFTGLLLPEYAGSVYKYAFPAFFGELALMLWLLIRGAKND